MESTTSSRSKPNIWIIIFSTVTLTVAIVITALYGLGMLGNQDSIHMQGLVHTEGMVHTDGMQHSPSSSEQRENEVAERGSMVMPFDLERSTHVFETTEFGGVQQVVSDDEDLAQIQLIQTHLIEEVDKFQDGDFSDPAMIHGEGMPGLAELEAGYKSIQVVYESLPNGGKVIYSAEDEQLIGAIQAWFEAQLADHGAHATDR